VNRMHRTSPLTITAFAAVGIAVGLLLQLLRSAQGYPPFVPPLTLAATLVVLAAVLIVLALLLRRAVHHADRYPVNPFHAVRLLAGARAAQFAGALFGGFGAGSLLQLLGRSVMPPSTSWAPMLWLLLAGAVLVVCGIIAELLCRVPPRDDDGEAESEGAQGAGSAS